MARILFVQPTIMPPGGGHVLAAWMLQALASEHRVTLLTWERPRLDVVDRHGGTTLASASFTVETVSPIADRVLRLAPVPATLYRALHLMRVARRAVGSYDLAVTADSEADLGPPAVQYIHYPKLALDRPDRDLSWYSRARLLRRAYQAIGCRLFGYSPARMARNRTLVNSEYMRAIVADRLGIEATVLHPPVPGDFPDVPWERRDDGFVCLARLSPEKRLLEIVEILAEVRRRHPTLTLDVVGAPDDHDYTRRLAERAREHGPWVRLHQDVSRDALTSLLAARRYGIHAMADEPFGMAVAELIRAGCVVFAPDTAGPAEIIGTYPLLTFRSAAEAIERIEGILASADAQRRARDHLSSRAVLFTTERFVAEIRAVVSEALARPHA
jgi:glycosyltransferase involved in cell wall biosynthesis